MKIDLKQYLATTYGLPAAVLAAWTPPPPRLEAEGNMLAPRDEGDVRTLHFFDPVDDWYGVTERDWLDATNGWAGEFRVLCNSPGGSAFHGIATMNVVAPLKARMEWTVIGVCASAATLPMMVAGSRLMAPMTKMLIHEARAVAIGTAATMRTAADMLEGLNVDIAKLYAGVSTLKDAEIAALMAEDRLMGAEEAVEKGFADAMAEEPEPAEAPENMASALADADLDQRLALALANRPH